MEEVVAPLKYQLKGSRAYRVIYIYAHIVEEQIVDTHSNVMIHLRVVKQIRMSTQHESPVMGEETKETIEKAQQFAIFLPLP